MGNEAIVKNYFEIEKALVCRLKETLANRVKEVYTPFSIEDMVESSQASPSLHVIYVGDSVPKVENGRSSVGVVQRWAVVLAVRNAKSQLQNSNHIREEAGVIILEMLNALQGWKPTEASRPLSRVTASPVGFSSSFAYFPFLFEAVVII